MVIKKVQTDQHHLYNHVKIIWLLDVIDVSKERLYNADVIYNHT